jgi:hypothetical protein
MLESVGRPSGGKFTMWLSIGLFAAVAIGAVVVYFVTR